MTKIYFFDIDNTLRDHRTNTIPESALNAIAALRQAGHTVVIATGRSFEDAKPFIDQIHPSYSITQNGARILKGEQEVLAIPLASEPLIDLFKWISEQGHYFGVNDGSGPCVSAAVPATLVPCKRLELIVQPDANICAGKDIYQGWLFFDEELDETLIPAILARYPDFDLVRWHQTAVDVLPKAINKWTGCQWVMEKTGFKPEQAVAFGDGLNDMEMLQGVGLGVAMDNGHPELKAVANRIAPALHLDGVATVLNELAKTRILPHTG